MKLKLIPQKKFLTSKKAAVMAIAMATNGTVAYADGFDTSMFSVKGFGTVGAVHSSEDQADFIGSYSQPNGAGLTHDWAMGVDSKLGVQLSANVTDKLTAVVQAISELQYDNSWRPSIEWANVKYQFTPEFSARIGRIVLPTFLLSDSRMVGYSMPWVRAPEEVYFNTLTTNSDGADITYRRQFGGAFNTVQAFYGNSASKSEAGKAYGHPGWGINDTIEIDALTLRAGYNSTQLDLKFDGLDLLYGGLTQFADSTAPFFPQASADAYAVVDRYPLNDIKVGIYSLGANYDPGNWFVMGEYVHIKGKSLIPDSDSFYVTAGYRIQQFTPYVTFAQIDTDHHQESDISSEELASIPAALSAVNQLNGGVNAVFTSFSSNQRTGSVGVRWDFMPNADLKIQYEHKTLSDDSLGRLSNHTGDFKTNGSFDVFSVAVDFVF